MRKLLGATVLAVAALAAAPTASADGTIDDFEANYADYYGADAICGFLDDTPTFTGVIAMTTAIGNDSGFDMDSSVDVMNYSVWNYCPRHWDLLTALGDAARAASPPQRKYLV